MDQERNLGVTEARFALTLLTCLLVAIGYIALLRLGGSKESTIDAGIDDDSPPIVTAPVNPRESEPQPRVLPLDTPQLTNRNALPNPSANPERR